MAAKCTASSLRQWLFNQRILIVYYNFSEIFSIVLAVCLMPLVTHYAQNYAGIIGWALLSAVQFLYNMGNNLQLIWNM